MLLELQFGNYTLYLRLFSDYKFLYIILNIIKETYLFVVFDLLIVLALLHVFLLSLQHTDFLDFGNIIPKTTSYTLQNNAGDTIGTSQQNFDRKQDNPSSLFLITIVQNMFITLLTSAYDEALKKGRAALLRYRAVLISEYEVIDEIHFSSPPLDPEYIYYSDESKRYDAREELVKKHEEKNFYDDLEKTMDKTELSFEEKDDENSLLCYNDEPENKNIFVTIKDINGHGSDNYSSSEESTEYDDD
ncbi:hypothetical protein GLOIN_2v865192 [Rhizophagus clarus]|uniref:Uncharacterized protein n=2 Tax=Rhizophagus clarus TaxID=94130 RepID=A0A8H3LIB5_9GLOM|nr:hypothetical protein GLOIN_2v865192 [Rhizophagus clarus]